MPYGIHYYPEQHLVLERLYGTLTMEEIKALTQEFAAYMASNQITVNLLVDLRETEKFPTNLFQLKEAFSGPDRSKMSWVVVLVGSNPISRFLTSMLTKLLSHEVRFRIFDSVEEAADFINKLDPATDLRRMELPGISLIV